MDYVIYEQSVGLVCRVIKTEGNTCYVYRDVKCISCYVYRDVKSVTHFTLHAH
jgi:hypothetical protein